MRTTNRIAAPGIVFALACHFALASTGAESKNHPWQTDFEAAKTRAKAEKKLLLVDFTGSDWCGWCIKLRQEVFDKEAFQAVAAKQFVLVELDYPRQKELPADLKAQNTKLAEKYKIRGFPTILLLDATGEVVAKSGYRPGGPEKYVDHLAEAVKIYESIQSMRAELSAAKGLDRAKLLDRLIEGYVKLGNEINEIEGWSKEIVTLDAKNEAGLKTRYEYRLLMAESSQLKQGKKFDEAKAALDKALALPGITAEQKQEALFAQGECFFFQKDFTGVVTSLKQALAAAPESPKAGNLKSMIAQFQAVADAQESVAKLKIDLEKAEGPSRAKLLDQLIEARGKLAGFIPDQTLPQEIEKLSQEILRLDPDNKAGLKQKYEFRALLAEAGRLSRTRKADEARAVLDKALAIPGLADAQIQESHFLKATTYLSDNDTEKGLESLRKALDAAPTGPKANLIKALIRRAEGQPKAGDKAKRPAKKRETKDD